MPAAGAHPAADLPAAAGRLTPREIEVLEAYIRHGRAKLMAHELGISLQSIKNHNANIMGKLGAVAMGQAVARYLLRGRSRVERRSGAERRSGQDRRV